MCGIYDHVFGLLHGNNPSYVVPVGSRLYGTDTPDSDYDFKGILRPTKDGLLGLKSQEQHNASGSITVDGKDYKSEITMYSARRWLELCVKGNPTVIELAFIDRNFALYVDVEIEPMIEWISKHARNKNTIDAYRGYLTAQFKEWLKKKDAWNNKLYDGGVRRDIFEKYGHDTKMASHVLRLAYQVSDLINNGLFNPTLSGQQLDLVRSIRNGSIDANEVLSILDLEYKNVNELIDSKCQTFEQNIEDVANSFLVDYHEEMLSRL